MENRSIWHTVQEDNFVKLDKWFDGLIPFTIWRLLKNF